MQYLECAKSMLGVGRRKQGDADGRHGIQHQKTTKIQDQFCQKSSKGIGFIFFENKDMYKSRISHFKTAKL